MSAENRESAFQSVDFEELLTFFLDFFSDIENTVPFALVNVNIK